MNVQNAHSMKTISLQPVSAVLLLAGAAAVVAWAVAGPMAVSPTLAWLLVGAPLVEEVVFRAGLQESLLRVLPQRLPRHGAGWALVLTAAAFAGAHLLVRPGWMSAATLLPALAIGLVYGRTRRLAPCVALHAAFNLLGAAVFGFPVTP
jgi:membrane protease YdiL (CAAX protease family)